MRLKHDLSFAKAMMGIMHRGRAFGGPYQMHLALTNRCNISGCDCYSCVHHTANLRVYQRLHPVKRRSDEFNNLSPTNWSEDF